MTTIFISYSHKDIEDKKLIEESLRIISIDHPTKAWSDTELNVGDDWRAEIDKKLASASIAILIVTNNFLTSEFIRNYELPYLKERNKTNNLRLIPIIAKPCLWNRAQDM